MTVPRNIAKGSEYRCAMCGGIYLSTGFDAQAELEENFQDMKDEPFEVVCDVCYKRLLALMS